MRRTIAREVRDFTLRFCDVKLPVEPWSNRLGVAGVWRKIQQSRH